MNKYFNIHKEFNPNLFGEALKIDVALSTLAAILNVTSFTLYNWQVFTGQTSPNVTSWAVWSFMTVLNFTSYQKMSKDFWKSLMPTLSSIQCVMTLILALFRGQAKAIDMYDVILLCIGIVASLLWWKLKSPSVANVMLQVGITIGFIPTFKSTWNNPDSEMPLCWFLWTTSFAIQTCVVLLRWKGKKQELAYPGNSTWLHLVVAILSLR